MRAPPTDRDTDRARRRATYGKLEVIASPPSAGTLNDYCRAGQIYELTEPRMFVGRIEGNDIVIGHRSISREHATIARDPAGGRYTITDLRAINGLRINGDRCIAHELVGGDIVELGQVRMRFIAPGEAYLWFDPEIPADPDRFLIVGSDAVVVRGDHVHVGSRTFLIDEVEQHAERGENLPLGGGRLLQGAMAMLVTAVR